MSSAESANGRRRPEFALTLAVYTSLLAAMFPLLRVIAPSWWLLGAALLAALVLAAGFLARRFRVPAVAVSLIEAGVWLVFMTIVFGRETALLGVLPTPATLRTVPLLVERGMAEIVNGAAPLDAGVPLAFLVVGATGLLAIIIDHVVLTARMPLLAAVGLIAVYLIPSIAVPSEADVSAFVLLSVSILFMIRIETSSREGEKTQRAPARTPGVSAAALGIGAIAIVVAVVATPLLPPPAVRAGSGVGFGGNSLDPSLQLGDDLRRPRAVEVLKVRTNAASAPYLRAVTLSEFDGQKWSPDTGRVLPLDAERSFTPITANEGVRVTEYTTTVEVSGLVSPWLPISFPAVAVTGLAGDWQTLPYNRTVLSSTTNSSGQRYVVVTHQPRPTLEQIRATEASAGDTRDATLALPLELPEIIEEKALEMTAGATNDYDRLIALQRWFRGSDFRYSLEAPVDDDFDGEGVDAVASFLDVKSGYCTHFASAFALMARTLEMPSRIVIGYLPGTSTTDRVEGETVYSVMSSQAHAWPEVYFDGIGWIAFEPTNSRGVATSFSPAAVPLPNTGVDVEPGATASPAPTSTASLGPEQNDQTPGASGGSSTGSVNALPGVTIALGVLLVLAIPALIRELRRRRQLAAARQGDAIAAWRSVQDAAIDLGIALPASETPRALAARLVAEHGAPSAEMGILVMAIERVSYARRGNVHGVPGDLGEAAASVRASLLSEADAPRRLVALLAPRSLVIQPGSVYAGEARGAGAPTRAR